MIYGHESILMTIWRWGGDWHSNIFLICRSSDAGKFVCPNKQDEASLDTLSY